MLTNKEVMTPTIKRDFVNFLKMFCLIFEVGQFSCLAFFLYYSNLISVASSSLSNKICCLNLVLRYFIAKSFFFSAS
jgi:hypothetical protein